MQKVVFLILHLALMTSAFEDQPSFYPENSEILQKCFQENQIPTGLKILNLILNADYPKIHAWFLCKAKSMNIYSEETGLDVDRLTYSYYRTQDVPTCRKKLVQDCFNKHNGVFSGGELILKVINCVVDSDVLNICNINKPVDH